MRHFALDFAFKQSLHGGHGVWVVAARCCAITVVADLCNELGISSQTLARLGTAVLARLHNAHSVEFCEVLPKSKPPIVAQ